MLMLAVLAPACHSPRIRDRPLHAWFPGPNASDPARGSLHRVSSEEIEYQQRLSQVELAIHPDSRSILALGRCAQRIGCRTENSDAASAIPWFRDAAIHARFTLATGPDPETLAKAVALHNDAVERLLRAAGTGPHHTNPAWREQLAAMGIEVVPTTPDRVSLPLDELWIASDYRVKNLDPVGQDGLGLPLITLSRFPDRDSYPGKFFPDRLRLPSTALLSPRGSLRGGAWRAGPSVLELHDPASAVCRPIPDAPGVRLAADFTTPMAHEFIRSPLVQLAWGGLLRPSNYNSAPGIFINGPYQKGKIPVLFVHGLWSSPDAWLRMANWLQADPVIRDRYQFWFAYYPTGAPVMASAVRLRESLRDLRRNLDPSGTDPWLDQMVVVGHSLGGVLSKQLVLTSGNLLEQGLFVRPFAEVRMSEETRQKLSRFLYFEREPSVRRLIFIAAPHRGSNTANQFIGRFGSALVRRPSEFESIHEEVVSLNGREVLQPFFQRRAPSSIDNLEWESPILQALARLPIPADIPYHSIVANLTPHLSPRYWTDGVVSYESAHLDGAESEVMVHYNHFANGTRDATSEVHRILRLHLTEIGAGF
ncbi:MAG: alpha/beta hydrolase [Isosphaeraceae bacterium]